MKYHAAVLVNYSLIPQESTCSVGTESVPQSTFSVALTEMEI